MRKSTGPEYLVRFDYDRVRGWQVRLPLWHPLSVKRGREYTEFFSDKQYGGDRGAHSTAGHRRDALMAGVVPPDSPRPQANTVHKRSSSGAVGITLAFREGRPGESAFSWRVVWQESPKKTKRRTFCVATYGFEEALEKALAIREKKTGLKFSKEQRLEALALHAHVVRYCKTGKRPILKPLKTQVRARHARARVITTTTERD
jgi:hypothetical protein